MPPSGDARSTTSTCDTGQRQRTVTTVAVEAWSPGDVQGPRPMKSVACPGRNLEPQPGRADEQRDSCHHSGARSPDSWPPHCPGSLEEADAPQQLPRVPGAPFQESSLGRLELPQQVRENPEPARQSVSEPGTPHTRHRALPGPQGWGGRGPRPVATMPLPVTPWASASREERERNKGRRGRLVTPQGGCGLQLLGAS